MILKLKSLKLNSNDIINEMVVLPEEPFDEEGAVFKREEFEKSFNNIPSLVALEFPINIKKSYKLREQGLVFAQL